ncbi:tryptophan synthase subunit alpha [Kangiella sp. HZ709]|uniref:tryptophan synthase subunit alpha n=1 Tax=Kangiella sp. HZ709 TaxID=2666328 RepID=UPI0012B0CB2F|nr:tryptophan synthase subunit alpha [Kangiella sp. HZ709]MRX27087.1 tryptophan synthase subunit alpha [Kangiella sp. HZ709]
MRYQKMFETKKANNALAYIPFVLLGDPTFDHSFQIIEKLIESGADALELGFAFSDPVADGPVIQEASLRPLDNGFSLKDGFILIQKVRMQYPDIPIGILTYANLVFAQGISHYYAMAKEAGVDSVLVADCPVQEASLFAEQAAAHNIDTVFIAPPDATDETLAQVAKHSQGYTYVLSRKGITGTEVSANQAKTDFLEKLRTFNSAPLVQGFGISTAEHVYQAAEAGVDGVITGSALVKIINQYYNEPHIMLDAIAKYAKTIATAAHQARNLIREGLINVDSGNDQRTTVGHGATS